MIDFLSEDMRRNPFPAYDRVRPVAPLLHVPRLQLWMIFDYDGVRRALLDHDAFRSSLQVASRPHPAWLVFFDPPLHTKLRAIIMRAFTPGVVANLEPRIRELSRDLLSRVLERGEMDLAADFSVPLPIMVIAEMFGIPVADCARFKQWSDTILNLSYAVSGGPDASAAAVAFKAAQAEMRAYLPNLVEQRLREPQDDLLTKLVHAEVDGERLADHELLGFFELLLVAGSETTTNLINNGILCLLEHPDQLARIRREHALLPFAIEEVLRYRSPFQWTLRATRRDVELHSQMIPAGQLVLPVMGSANRDPRQFAHPDRFDITRDPNPHLAFGHGIHFCLGAALSRLEARIALADLLERQDMELTSAAPWEPRKALHVHGPTSLPVRFRPEPGRVLSQTG